MLFLFSLSTIAAGANWNAIAPIASILHDNQGLSYTEINLFTEVYYIGFLIMTFPTNFLVERYGLRPALIVGTFLLAAGQWLRLFFNNNFYIAVIGQSLGALANPIFLNTPSKIAVVWFKPSSRTMATTIAAVANILGNCLSEVVPVQMVHK